VHGDTESDRQRDNGPDGDGFDALWRSRMCGIGDEAAPGLLGQLRVHRELRVEALELRTLDGKGLHELTPCQLSAAVSAVREAEVAVPVLASPIGGWSTDVGAPLDGELRLLEVYAAAADALGASWVRVMSYPNDGRAEGDWGAEAVRRMGVLARAAEGLGVGLLHENCAGWAGQGPAEALRMLEEVDSPALRLVFDTGNGLAYGYRSADYLAAVLPWVAHVHVKDGRRGVGDAGPVWTLPGAGEAEVAACLRLLEEAGYTGFYSLEPHVAHIPHLGVTDPARLAEGYGACAAAFRELWAGYEADAARRKGAAEAGVPDVNGPRAFTPGAPTASAPDATASPTVDTDADTNANRAHGERPLVAVIGASRA
jgi:sugar phosphate isomerase/epimerase